MGVAFNDAPAQTGNTNVDMSAYQHFDPSDNEGDAPGNGYNSFNQFFSRQFKNLSLSRPVSQPDADMLVTAPGDVEINFIYAQLTADTKIRGLPCRLGCARLVLLRGFHRTRLRFE